MGAQVCGIDHVNLKKNVKGINMWGGGVIKLRKGECANLAFFQCRSARLRPDCGGTRALRNACAHALCCGEADAQRMSKGFALTILTHLSIS